MNDHTTTLDPESRAADRAAHRGNPALDVLKWLHEVEHGILGTLSTEDVSKGFPTGSIVPFALDQLGRPFILTAGIARHTRNLRQDNRASLFIHDGQAVGDPQTSWRASINGHFVQLRTDQEDSEGCERISEDEYAQLLARYSQRVPKATSYLKTHAFRFWRMNTIKSIRYIAGFGRICSFAGDDYFAEAGQTPFETERAGALAHMNDDHVGNMQEISRALHATDAEHVRMTALERTGCLLQTTGPDGYQFHPFTKVVEKPQELKSEIIGLLKRARAQGNAA
jgi:putative heme iron utilization protein